jgi:DNA-binding protein HU-beta
LTFRLKVVNFCFTKPLWGETNKEARMNKAELIERVAKESNISKSDVEKTLNSMIDIIKKSIKKGDDVKLIGFGTFTRSKRQARTGRNPQTGTEIKIPACNVPKFKPGKEFKDLIN